VHCSFVEAHAHRRGIRLEAARLQRLKNLRDARLVADGREWIIIRAPRLGRVFASLAVNLKKLLGLRVIIFPIVILDRPLGRNAVVMLELFKILFAQPEQRRAINLRVAADVITEARINLAAFPVEHLLGRIILERTFVAPVLLLAWQKRSTLQHKNVFAAGRKTIQERAAARARADDDDVKVFVHDGSWSVARGKPYRSEGHTIPVAPSLCPVTMVS